ncbi:hypothetical protein PoB_004096300 [Plakobranchus ocellatus]|uniref:Uncharacterized protein n=1 Tax=Plakobranchus ocellatus TaxID=259542 RepID=A0AAV4B6S0_9GAST|nr:hypothetical protein PoB_004096300 [Plakobranchus ocellatus]
MQVKRRHSSLTLVLGNPCLWSLWLGKDLFAYFSHLQSLKILNLADVVGTVACESTLRFAGTLLLRVEPRHQRSGLTEGLKA